MAQHNTGQGEASVAPPETSIFDRASALKRLGDDEPLFQEMIQFFLEDSPALVQEIREGLRERNTDRTMRAAHSLKGLAATFSAHQAVEAARVMEAADPAADPTGAQRQFEVLEFEIERLCDALVAEHSASNNPHQ